MRKPDLDLGEHGEPATDEGGGDDVTADCPWTPAIRPRPPWPASFLERLVG